MYVKNKLIPILIASNQAQSASISIPPDLVAGIPPRPYPEGTPSVQNSLLLEEGIMMVSEVVHGSCISPSQGGENTQDQKCRLGERPGNRKGQHIDTPLGIFEACSIVGYSDLF